jgi:hypothetical protein
VPDNAYANKTIPQGFVIPDSVTTIGEYAFQKAILPKGFTIPESVVSINHFAFSQIDQLPETFALPSNLTEISSGLF